jgi:hypothetical protein
VGAPKKPIKALFRETAIAMLIGLVVALALATLGSFIACVSEAVPATVGPEKPVKNAWQIGIGGVQSGLEIMCPIQKGAIGKDRASNFWDYINSPYFAWNPATSPVTQSPWIDKDALYFDTRILVDLHQQFGLSYGLRPGWSDGRSPGRQLRLYAKSESGDANADAGTDHLFSVRRSG